VVHKEKHLTKCKFPYKPHVITEYKNCLAGYRKQQLASEMMSGREQNPSELERDFEQLTLSEVTTRKELDRGSYGIVYEVEIGGTRFAAKKMHSILRSAENDHKFLNECLRCSRICHPNVVQFIGLHRPNPWPTELPWLVMELMDTSLAKFIHKYSTRSKDIPIHFKLSILLDTSRGLQFLHSKNLIHRGLSSNNILLTRHCIAKIADLGVAKVVKEGTQSFTIGPGTPAFLPPEARVASPMYGPPYDIFSFGCVCIHLISMQFPKPTADMLLDTKGRATHADLTEFERRVEYLTKFPQTPDLRPLVERCLNNAPKDRPGAADVIEYLNNVNYERQPHDNDGIIDLYDVVCAYKTQLEEKNRDLEEREQEMEEKDIQLAIAESERAYVTQQLKKFNETVIEKEHKQPKREADLEIEVIIMFIYCTTHISSTHNHYLMYRIKTCSSEARGQESTNCTAKIKTHGATAVSYLE